MNKKFFKIMLQMLIAAFSLGYLIGNHAETLNNLKNPLSSSNDLVKERIKNEEKTDNNPYAIAFHYPTYILPFYFTGSPDTKIYNGNTPSNESLKHDEFKYQISFKVPLMKNILQTPTSLYLAYTQMSYWQLYNHSAFFRETDYQPELFLLHVFNVDLHYGWRLNLLNVGFTHQSNGFGNALERSWNRGYVMAVVTNNNLMISVRPWIIFQNNLYKRQNPDMGKYMGYGEVVAAYKYANQVFALEIRNVIESCGQRAGLTLSWSFPVSPYLKGYVQAFSGYGQSLIEYNHRTNSVGIGVALSNWVQ